VGLAGQRLVHRIRGQLLAGAGRDALAEQGDGQQAARRGGAGPEQPGADAGQDARMHPAEADPSRFKSR